MAARGRDVTRILILWLLVESPLHGYAVRRILAERGLAFWFPVDYGSIYAVLGALERQGYAQALETEREGARPERTRYAITPRGRRHLEELLREAWRHISTAADPVQAALLARDELEGAEVTRLLEQRVGDLEARLAALHAMARSAPDPAMVTRQLVLTQAELAWAREQLQSPHTPIGEEGAET
jgi:DNA-binding PadR family transcriptional regulator